MRLPFLALSSGLGVILALQSPIRAQAAADSQLPVSMERIRAALAQPPSLLQVPLPSGDVPTFRIEVRQRPLVPQLTDAKPFDPTFGLPSVGELVMGGIENIRLAAVHYTRRRAERRARKEVDDAVAAFCAIRRCAPPDTGK